MLLARCPAGHVFRSTANDFFTADAFGENVTISGNIESCPVCGRDARCDDFYGSVAGGVIGAVRNLTPTAAQELHRVVERGVKAEQNPSDLAKAVEAISPEMATVIRKFARDKVALGIVTAAALLALSKCNVSLEINVNDLAKDLMKPRPAVSQSVHPPKPRLLPGLGGTPYKA